MQLITVYSVYYHQEMTALTFSSLGLDNWLTQQIENVGLKEPTLVQQNCIPPILQGIYYSHRTKGVAFYLNVHR